MKLIMMFVSMCAAALMSACAIADVDPSVVVDAVALVEPFLPVWGQVAVLVFGSLWGAFVTVVRPKIPPSSWAKTGSLGQVIDKYIAGNRAHTVNRE